MVNTGITNLGGAFALPFYRFFSLLKHLQNLSSIQYISFYITVNSSQAWKAMMWRHIWKIWVNKTKLFTLTPDDYQVSADFRNMGDRRHKGQFQTIFKRIHHPAADASWSALCHWLLLIFIITCLILFMIKEVRVRAQSGSGAVK